MGAIPFEIQNGIHHVLQEFGTGDGAVFGDMADEEDGDIGALSQLDQLKGGFPDLGDGTGGGRQAGGIQGLDGVQGQIRRAWTDSTSLKIFSRQVSVATSRVER